MEAFAARHFAAGTGSTPVEDLVKHIIYFAIPVSHAGNIAALMTIMQ